MAYHAKYVIHRSDTNDQMSHAWIFNDNNHNIVVLDYSGHEGFSQHCNHFFSSLFLCYLSLQDKQQREIFYLTQSENIGAACWDKIGSQLAQNPGITFVGLTGTHVMKY